MKKKIAYFLPIIILVIYTILLYPITYMVINNTQIQAIEKDGTIYLNGGSHFMLNLISNVVIIISIILKVFLKSNKFEINKKTKIITIVTMGVLICIIEIWGIIAFF